MAGGTRPDILTDVEYERMLALLGGNAKGRIFLAEFASQAQAEDTRALFAALAAIQSSLGIIREQLRPEAVAAELRRIAGSLGEPLERAGPANVDSRQTAAVHRACAELAALADALARGVAPGAAADAGGSEERGATDRQEI